MPKQARSFGWHNRPPDVRAQLADLLDATSALLGHNLGGVYLHGSLALGCFNPARSDVDLLVITERAVVRDAKLGLVQALLARSGRPAPLELSVLARADISPWCHPAPYRLHFSEDWRERLAADVAGLGWLRWPDVPGTDPDLAAHLTVARERGIALLGPPPSEALPEVPPADYLDSILRDVADAATAITRDPVYVVLNLCRVYSFVLDGRVASKDEGGAWGRTALPEPLRLIVEQALALYRGRRQRAGWDGAALQHFQRELQAMIYGALAAKPERAIPP
jgi:streptomycin 3"-adenylyltransferase